MSEIKRIITRKPSTIEDRVKALLLITSINTDEIKPLPEKPSLGEILCEMYIDGKLIVAAKLLGFETIEDMIDFTDMYGYEGLIEQ